MKTVSTTASFPAPTGGWNARDALASMDKQDAVQLDNYVPGTANVYLRGGSARYAQNVGQLSAFTRASSATYIDSSGVLHTVASNVPRYTYTAFGSQNYATALLVEAAGVNRALYSRDLTNAAWVKTNITAALNQQGIDGGSNSASLITATTANATVLQTITDASKARVFSAYIKLVTGNLTMTINGSSYSSVSFAKGVWVRVSITATSANPVIGFKLSNIGDSFAIDFAQEENGTTPTSAIATTGSAGARAADTPTYTAGSTYNTVAYPVETIVSYAGGAATNMLAAVAGGIYDCSSGGPVGLPLANGYGSNRWQYVNMNAYSLLFNGIDTPQKYDGTAITANTITGTGLTPANLIYPCLHQHRLFVVEKNSMNVWYLGLDAISGAASKLDFSTYCRLGGHMVAVGTWTRDGGSGPDDYAVFLTSRGEALVYRGTDPSNASTWALVGVFDIGPPIGQRPLVQDGADLIAITLDGFVPLSKVLPLDRIGAKQVAISDKIRGAVSDATQMYKNNFGWQAIFYPQGNWGVFNVPLVENTQQQQYVVNTLTNAWCRFVGLTANCWELFRDNLFYGSNNGIVMQADYGLSDDNGLTASAALVDIVGDIKPAFSYFSARSRQKKFNMVRPLIESTAPVNISVSLCTNFRDVIPTLISTPPATGAVWDISPWDRTPWSSDLVIRENWLGIGGIGYNATCHFRTSTSGIAIAFDSIDWLYEPGGVL